MSLSLTVDHQQAPLNHHLTTNQPPIHPLLNHKSDQQRGPVVQSSSTTAALQRRNLHGESVPSNDQIEGCLEACEGEGIEGTALVRSLPPSGEPDIGYWWLIRVG